MNYRKLVLMRAIRENHQIPREITEVTGLRRCNGQMPTVSYDAASARAVSSTRRTMHVLATDH